MQNTWNVGLSDRLKASANTKKNRLEHYRAAAADPALAAKLEERRNASLARDERLAERARAIAEQEAAVQAAAEELRLAAEAAAQQEAEQRAAADRERVARVIGDEAARKAERDRRYAQRKARNS